MSWEGMRRRPSHPTCLGWRPSDLMCPLLQLEPAALCCSLRAFAVNVLAIWNLLPPESPLSHCISAQASTSSQGASPNKSPYLTLP